MGMHARYREDCTLQWRRTEARPAQTHPPDLAPFGASVRSGSGFLPWPLLLLPTAPLVLPVITDAVPP